MNESATPLLSAQEILSKLTRYVDGAPYPKAAVEAAIAQREEMTPLLLAALEKAAADPGAIGDADILHVYALYLLAQFGEVRAYPLILKLVSASSEAVEAALGDLVNEDLARVLLSVFNGDTAALKALAENEANDEYVRAAALETLVVLAIHGKIERSEVVEYFRSLFNGKLSLEDESFVWTGLILACMDIHPGDLMEEIRLAYKSGLIDGELITFGEVEDAAAEEVASSLASLAEDTQPITDTVASMNWWACFQPAGSGGSFGDFGDGDIEAAEGAEKPGVPVRAPEKIGRNEPCPCGSQKKYKKCCGKDA